MTKLNIQPGGVTAGNNSCGGTGGATFAPTTATLEDDVEPSAESIMWRLASGVTVDWEMIVPAGDPFKRRFKGCPKGVAHVAKDFLRAASSNAFAIT